MAENTETAAVDEARTGPETAAETTKKPRKKTAPRRQRDGSSVSGTETAKTVPAVSRQEEPPGLVKILYIDSVMPGNQIPIGNGAMITGSGRIFTKTLEEFNNGFITRMVQSLIKARKFIILSGLTDEQREDHGCKYADGEVLKSTGLFEYLLNCGVEQAKEIYSALCVEHREMVCTYLISRKEAGDQRVTVDLLRAFDDISRDDYADHKSPLSQVLA